MEEEDCGRVKHMIYLSICLSRTFIITVGCLNIILSIKLKLNITKLHQQISALFLTNA